MPTKPALTRYYPTPKDVRKQLPYIWPIIILFVVTIIYASGLRDHTIRTVILCLSLVYPVVILFSISFATSKLHTIYFQLDSDGVYVTLLGFIHKRIYWSDVERVDKVAIGGNEGIGLLYKPSFNRYVFGRQFRKRTFGWDEMLGDAHQTGDGSLLHDAIKSYKAYSRRASK